MADIAMCQDAECPSRMTCRRFIDAPSVWQSYMDFSRGDSDKCGDYWKWRQETTKPTEG